MILNSRLPMPVASYQCTSALAVSPLASLTSPNPLRFRHLPRPYRFRRRATSRMPESVAKVSTRVNSPTNLKCIAHRPRPAVVGQMTQIKRPNNCVERPHATQNKAPLAHTVFAPAAHRRDASRSARTQLGDMNLQLTIGHAINCIREALPKPGCVTREASLQLRHPVNM